MTIDIKTLIEQRPHLKDPLELYAKCLRFQQEAAALLPKERAAMSPEDAKAYPREVAGDLYRLFVSIFALPAEKFAPLGLALEKGEIDFMRLPLDETPEVPDLPHGKEEMAGLFFLLARPYFLALRQAFPLDGQEWQGGRCPLCSARAALTSVVEGPKRQLHCSFCGTVGPYRFIGCPNCGTVEADKLNTIMSEDEPGFRITTCESCRTYVKVVEGTVLQEMTLDQADIASLPLDLVAQGKGYARLAPNPISLKNMG